MIFLTVGTQFSFDRLVKAVDQALAQGASEEKVFAQIGDSSYQPRNFEAVSSLDKDAFDEYMRQATGIISHAGIGTMTMALDDNKPLLVMPRLKKYKEVVNDHQVAIAQKFAEMGYILAAYREEEVPENIAKLEGFVPRRRQAQAEAITQKVAQFLSELKQNR